MLRLVLALLIFGVLFPSAGWAQVLNEIQTSNTFTIEDEDVDTPDWIELYNPSAQGVSLNGFGLSDRAGEPFKWVFPDVTLAPGQYLLVYASGKNKRIAGQTLHTNFSLSADGEDVVLTSPEGVRVDFVPATALYTDISFGRSPDGTGAWRYFGQPTPGAANTTQSHPAVVPAPRFSREGGPYTTAFWLTFEVPPGASVRYTTDGSLPLPGTGLTYTGPIMVNRTQIIRAIAYRGDELRSMPVSQIYTRLGEEVQGFSSNLPVVILQEHQLPITPGDKTPATMVLLSDPAGGRTHLSTSNALTSRIVADIRGSSSQSFPQKMFGFHLQDEFDGNRDEGLLGMPADHNWILYAPYGEKSLMRNVLAYTLAAGFGRYAPRTRFVELFLHNGDGPVTQAHYHGVYVLVERIRPHADRVNIAPLSPMDATAPNITGGYIISKDRLNAGENGFFTSRGTRLRFVRPEEHELTAAQRTYMRTYMTNFETALFRSTFQDPDIGYAAFIETHTFIDHFLITEMLKEIDGYRLSTFMYKNRGEKLVMGPVWDFNLSAGNANYLNGGSPTGWYYLALGSTEHCGIGCQIRDWYVRLMQDPQYVQRMRYRWWQLRQDLFSEEHIEGLIAQFSDQVREAQARHYTRWPILGTYVWPNFYVGPTWQAEVDWMRNWIRERLAWMDAQMGTPMEVSTFEPTYFWHITSAVQNDTPLLEVRSTFPAESVARVRFQSALAGYPFSASHPMWRKGSMERRNSPTALNYLPAAVNGQPYQSSTMRGIQVRQPFRGDAGEHALIFDLPTVGMSGIRFAFAALNEGAAERLLVDYSTAAGEPVWRTSGLNRTTFTLSQTWQRFEVDFSFLPHVDQNPNFKVRIRFDGPNMTEDAGNRVTFNNFSLEALERMPVSAPWEETASGSPPALFPNPVQDQAWMAFTLDAPASVEGRVVDLLGREVLHLSLPTLASGTHRISLDTRSLSPGMYLLQLEFPHAVHTVPFVRVGP